MIRGEIELPTGVRLKALAQRASQFERMAASYGAEVSEIELVEEAEPPCESKGEQEGE